MRSLTPTYLTNLLLIQSELSPPDITAFREMIYVRFHANLRPMAWRETTDPYCILVSEIMLQQTQVERVKLKYSEFLAAFPTFSVLAAAPLSAVLSVWQGLGYNRRAMYLQRCCQEIVSHYGGAFPRTVVELQALPGIGPYTARAVAAFSFGVAEPLIETNIRTVFIHFFFHGCAVVNDRDIMPLIAVTLDQTDPRLWYYALMDYGGMLKQTLPNPSRRSRHHTQQTRFEGSNRQLRSRILRQIMVHPYITLEELVTSVVAEPETVWGNLEAMQREGLLERENQGFYIAGENKRGQR